jgi:hypothetical protein
MAYNKLTITSTYDHVNEIIDLTDSMCVKVGDRVKKTEPHFFKLNMIKMASDEAMENAVNAHYNLLLKLELAAIIMLIVAASAFGMLQ